MIKFLINRPVAVLMTTLAFLMLGIVAMNRIPTSLIPDIPIPVITVQVSYPNNTARELETNVVRLLRNQLLQVSNLKDINSETRDGFSTLKLQFEYGVDVDLAFIEVNEKIDASLNYLPSNIERPRVIKASATDIPIVNLTVSLENNFSEKKFLELSDFTETVLKKRIEQLPDVALADINGVAKPEILVIPNIKKIQSLGIKNSKLVKAIKENNFELGNLLVQNGVYQYNFKFANPLKNKIDLENLYLNINDKLFQLKDLAEVSLTSEEEKGLVYVNGKRAITLAIIKQADAKVYNLKESLEKLTKSFIKDYPDLNFTTNQDQTKLLKLSIDNLKSSLAIGGLLAVFIMFLFLNDFKSPLIIAISIPISLVISVFFMYLLGLSINIISLSGLILGVGMMIDNAIIVIDNINQKLESKYSIIEACIRGTNEIITPLISSVLTTCSVFLPLMFLSGISGALFFDQAMAVAIGLISSLLVSILLIPVLFRHIRNKKVKKILNYKVQANYTHTKYIKGYNYFLKKKNLVFGISFLFVILAVFFLFNMKYSQLPEINQNEIILSIDWNEDINVKENQERVNRVFENMNSIKTIYSQVGENEFLLQNESSKSFSEVSIYIEVSKKENIKEIEEKINDKLNKFHPKPSFSFNKPRNIFQYLFGNDKNNLTAQCFSRNTLELPPEKDLQIISELITDQSHSGISLKETIFIEILTEKVLLYGISYNDLKNQLKTIFNYNFIDNLKTSQRFIPIKLNYKKEDFEKKLQDLFITNKNGDMIPINNLIKIYPEQQYRSILANKKGEYLEFKLRNTIKPNKIINKIRDTFINQERFDVRFGGSYFDLKELKKELIVVICVAVFLLYFIMAAQFESLWQPLVILLEIPIDIGGALLFLWLFGGTINIMSAIGIVVMTGVIINDSILKLHTINLLRKQGMGINEAIKKGGELRLKPILMTSLTTILALLPFLFIKGLGAELQKPLALTVIGGMLIGTFISLYFIPLTYKKLSDKLQ